MIVKDPPGTLPKEYEDLPEYHLFLAKVDMDFMKEESKEYQDCCLALYNKSNGLTDDILNDPQDFRWEEDPLLSIGQPNFRNAPCDPNGPPVGIYSYVKRPPVEQQLEGEALANACMDGIGGGTVDAPEGLW